MSHWYFSQYRLTTITAMITSNDYDRGCRGCSEIKSLTTGLNPSLSRLTNGTSPRQSYPVGRGLPLSPTSNSCSNSHSNSRSNSHSNSPPQILAPIQSIPRLRRTPSNGGSWRTMARLLRSLLQTIWAQGGGGKELYGEAVCGWPRSQSDLEGESGYLDDHVKEGESGGHPRSPGGGIQQNCGYREAHGHQGFTGGNFDSPNHRACVLHSDPAGNRPFPARKTPKPDERGSHIKTHYALWADVRVESPVFVRGIVGGRRGGLSVSHDWSKSKQQKKSKGLPHIIELERPKRCLKNNLLYCGHSSTQFDNVWPWFNSV